VRGVDREGEEADRSVRAARGARHVQGPASFRSARRDCCPTARYVRGGSACATENGQEIPSFYFCSGKKKIDMLCLLLIMYTTCVSDVGSLIPLALAVESIVCCIVVDADLPNRRSVRK